MNQAEAVGGETPVVQKTGYGCPPVEHRFQKGQSGNPRGRQRGSKNRVAEKLDPADQPTKLMIQEEAYRLVKIREGDKTTEVPVIQAALRALGVSAMKGNRGAQKTFAELVQRLEAGAHEDRLELFKAAVEFKEGAIQEIEECRARGEPEPAIVPHPDDIEIDVRRGTALIAGPMTEDEKAQWDTWLGLRDQAQNDVSECATKFERARDAAAKEAAQRDWLTHQRTFDRINNVMPARYKAQLKNRSWHPDASQEEIPVGS